MDDIRYEHVAIDSRNPALFAGIAGAPALRLTGELYLPGADAAPPFPAVVATDARGGLKTAREREYARHLAEAGYAVLVHDSYAARGFAGRAHPMRYVRVSEAAMLCDAFAAQTALAARDDIDAARIHHLGFGFGGMIALLSAFEQLRAACGAGEGRFASHASFYGLNALRVVDYRTTGAPAAIFYGGQDETLNHARLDLMAGDLENGGSPVRATGYDAAGHEWDREAERPGVERVNLRALAGRIEPGNRLVNDDSGRPIASARARAVWLCRAASLFGVRKVRNEEVCRAARADLLAHLDGTAGAASAEPASGGATVVTLPVAGSAGG